MRSSMANSTRRVLRLLQSPATAMVAQAKKAPLVTSQLLVPSNGAVPVVAVHQGKSYATGASATPISLAAAMAATAAGALALASIGFEGPAQCEAPTKQTQAPGGYEGNPIQHVAALLRLYEEIDKNMAVLAGRMLDELEKKIEEEKKTDKGKLALSPEQRALQMSIEFEATLERVQDSVFRNNYVTKEQVQDAIERMMNGNLRGGGEDGQISVHEAESIQAFVKNLGRMRWKCTGSRQPLINTHSKKFVTEDKPSIDVHTVVQVMEQLIPSLTDEMEALVRQADAQKLPAPERRQFISKEYIRKSGELTEQICTKHKLDIREFQAALMFYHDNELFEQALARLSAEQKQRFAKLRI